MTEIDELKALMRKNLETSQESLNILRKIQRARRVSGVLKILKWMAIIALTLGLYYYVEPYVKNYIDIFENLSPFIPK